MQRNNSTITTWSNSIHQMLNSSLIHPIISCDDLFNQTSTGNSEQLMKEASIFIDTCLFEKKDNEDLNFNFYNGLEILQSASGQTMLVYFHFEFKLFIIFIYFSSVTFIKYRTEIKMNPTGKATIKFGSSSIVSSNSHFHAKKGSPVTSTLTKIDGIIKTY